MHSLDVRILQGIHLLCVMGLAIYGLHALWLTICYWRRSKAPLAGSTARCNTELFNTELSNTGWSNNGWSNNEWFNNEWPHVTVQLPIYNERYVAERVINACMHLDYPQEKLTVQVLDDSDDRTVDIIQECVRKWQIENRQIHVIRRPQRTGFKAGALAYAAPMVQSDYVAIFDADFVPNPDFLRSTLPHFFLSGNEQVGFIQTRWAHLNAGYSALTRGQALALDGHFVVEQGGRQAASYHFGFNGSAGLWRQACIDDSAVGGWQADTLCEDLDLSYRAQIAGWRGLYLNHVEAPAEIPPQILAFKRQQFRWAKGSVQTLRKLGKVVWQGPWSLPQRIAAICHLGGYLVHPCLLMLLLISLPLKLLDIDPLAPLAFLGFLSCGPPVLYAVAQHNLHPKSWFRRWLFLSVIMLMGTGLAFNNTIAVYQGLTGRSGQFLRTPKFNVSNAREQWQGNVYRLPLQPAMLAEAILAIYALISAVVFGLHGDWLSVPFLLVYCLGFGLMTTIGLIQAYRGAVQIPRRRRQVQHIKASERLPTTTP